MLRTILREFEATAGTLCVEDLAQRLEISSGALEGMLATLVFKGYLVELQEQPAPCAACVLRSGCLLIGSGGRRYALASRKRTLHAGKTVLQHAAHSPESAR